MENKTIQNKKDDLMNSLSPAQKEYFPAIDWFYNGPRGAGRTYLSCVAALVGLLNGQLEVFILDHSPYHEGNLKYIRNMVHGLAYKIEFAIESREVRGGVVIRKAPEFVQYEIEYRKGKKNVS